MTTSAPPRPPSERATPDSKPLEREEIEALVEALVEEARRETRRRHRRYWAVAALVTIVGVVVLTLLEGGAASQTASPALSARMDAAAQAAPSRIAFTQRRGGGQIHGGLYVMNADGSGKRRLADVGSLTPSWSPDGRKIAFGNKVVNADGSGLQRLTFGKSPAWSPDGQRIAFTRHSGGRAGSFQIYVMNGDGSGERRLTQAVGGRPVWSPDGREIAFASRQPQYGNFDIYVVNADGSGLRRLTRASWGTHPVWSPDGEKIAYVRNYDIWVTNPDGSGPRRLTRTAARELSPAWSPDGRTIAFDRRIGRRPSQLGSNASSFAIYLTNADGTGQRRLAVDGSRPLWSPGGEKIAFSRVLGDGIGSAPENWEVFVMNADGSDQRNVTRNRAWDDCCPAWSPAQ